MILRYHPEGDETAQEFQFDLGRLRSKECEAIEKRTGMPYGSTFKEKLLQGHTLARRAMLWTMLRRKHHTLIFDDVEFADSELTVEMETHELVEAIEQLRTSEAIADELRAPALAALQADLESRTDHEPAAEPAADDTAEEAPAGGKAPGRRNRSASS